MSLYDHKLASGIVASDEEVCETTLCYLLIIRFYNLVI